MPRPCNLCRYPARKEVDAILLEGTESFRSIAKRIGTSPAGVLRHRDNHLPERMVRAHDAREIAAADSLTGKLLAIEAEARRIGKKAEAEGDLRAALMAVRELVRMVELAAKMSGELKDEHVSVNVALPPEIAAGMAAIYLERRKALPAVESIPAEAVPAKEAVKEDFWVVPMRDDDDTVRI